MAVINELESLWQEA